MRHSGLILALVWVTWGVLGATSEPQKLWGRPWEPFWNLSDTSWNHLGPQDGPRGSQDGPDSLQNEAQDLPKLVPRRSKNEKERSLKKTSKTIGFYVFLGVPGFLGEPRLSKKLSKNRCIGQENGQEGPRDSQDLPKRGPRASKRGPRATKSQKDPQNASKEKSVLNMCSIC